MQARIDKSHPRLPELLRAALDTSEGGQERMAALMAEAFPAAAQPSPGPSGQAILTGKVMAVLTDYRVLGYTRDPCTEIMEIEEALPAALCDALILAADDLNAWARSSQIRGDGAPYFDEGRTSNAVGLASLPASLRDEASALLESAGRLYTSWHPHAPKGLRPEHWEILRYLPGERFGLHVDAVAGHPRFGRRQLSIVAYLNSGVGGLDPSDPDGETEFPRQDVAVDRTAGKAIVFPSGWTHPHEGRIAGSTKYSLVGWLSA